jgi:Raf kinase inhibitor-like YbhB/YbcL family protein
MQGSPSSRVRVAGTALLAAALIGGCGSSTEKATAPKSGALPIRLVSPVFTPGGRLPARFTCTGQGTFPPLRWAGVPAAARELGLYMVDPDAPSGPFVHWVVLALSPRSGGLPAGTKPATLRLGRASSGRTGYEPPCPPKGASPHHYVFTLYALRKPAGLPYAASAADARSAFTANAIARGQLTATFSR